MSWRNPQTRPKSKLNQQQFNTKKQQTIKCGQIKENINSYPKDISTSQQTLGLDTVEISQTIIRTKKNGNHMTSCLNSWYSITDDFITYFV